ncbi:MAG TPA: DmsC/YnfH family molybdoenzyme membrane anchor subunit, partial [Acidimicrobiales bacterium]|nr:DmsC/YnfH family molybdoenzyme membrane anchor subunit [Acidimicrobiales bacterium]
VPPAGEGADSYLADQADLTAVERFSVRADAHVHTPGARPDIYRDLIPAGPPGAGRQLAFEVDLDACTGCKACVAACHRLNGLDDGEAWRTTTLVRSAVPGLAGRQTVTAACHHCADPACMKGCPVDAYDKDPVTGIVVHLDDQCIGCSYCTLTCPYEVPVFNPTLGIVRKCDMCHGRLAAGEAPACVQGCPNDAITIGVVDLAEARAAAGAGGRLPGAPTSALTAPTTRYRTARAGDGGAGRWAAVSPRRPAHGHPPLAVMLVLTQSSLGALLAAVTMSAVGADRSAVVVTTGTAVVAAGAGMAASLAHLGRPLHAWRAVIGLRHSWLSREVAAFGAYLPALAAFTGLVVLGSPFGPVVTAGAGALAAGAGVAGVACSVMIYVVTGRRPWTLRHVASAFGLTAVAGGLASALVALAAAGVIRRVGAGPGSPLASWASWAHLFLAALVLAGFLAVEVARRCRFFTTSAPPP